MPIQDSKMRLTTDVDGFNANCNSTNEIDFGYADPNCGKNGKFGCHILITETYTDLTQGGDFVVMHSAAAAPAVFLISRRLLPAQMVAGAHFFIPFPPTNRRYVRLKTIPGATTSTNGKYTAWLGPDEDGTQ
jgi:hypothetical protein